MTDYCRVYTADHCVTSPEGAECTVACQLMLQYDRAALEEDDPFWGWGSVREGMRRYWREKDRESGR